MKRFSLYAICVAVFLSISGCYQQPYQYPSSGSVYQQTTYSVDNANNSYSDKNFSLSVTPKIEDAHYRGFTLAITNKTNSPLKIIWNESYFLDNGTAKGGFMFEGIQYAQRNAPKQDLLVLPNSSITKDIYPNDKVIFLNYDTTAARMGLPSGWIHGVMTNGTFGAYIQVKGNKINKEVTVTSVITED